MKNRLTKIVLIILALSFIVSCGLLFNIKGGYQDISEDFMNLEVPVVEEI